MQKTGISETHLAELTKITTILLLKSIILYQFFHFTVK